MYGRRYRRKRSFRRVVVTLLTFVMLLSVCFPGLSVRAEDGTGETQVTVPADPTVAQQLTARLTALQAEVAALDVNNYETSEEYAAAYADLSARVAALDTDINTAYTVDLTISEEEYKTISESNTLLTDLTAKAPVTPTDLGDEGDTASSSSDNTTVSDTTSTTGTTAASSETTVPVTSTETTAPATSAETTAPATTETTAPAMSEAAVAFWARYDALALEVEALQIEASDFDTTFGALYSSIGTLNNEVAEAATAGTITSTEYADLTNSLVQLAQTLAQKKDANVSYAQSQLATATTGSVTVSQGGSGTVTLSSSNNATISNITLPTSSNGITFSQSGRTLTVSAASTTPAGTYTFTLSYTVTTTSGGGNRPGGGSSSSSSTEYEMTLTVIVQSERDIVLGKFDNSSYPVYLAVRQDGQIPGEPSVQGSAGYNFYNSSYSTGGGWANTFASTADGIIDESIVDYQNFFYTSVDGSQTVGLVDSSGVTIKAVLTGVNWDSLLNAIVNSGNVYDKDGTLITSANKDQYTVVPYVIKLQETDGTGWHIDCSVVKKSDVILSYDINIPNGYVITSSGVGVPNAQTGTPPATFTVGSMSGLSTIDGNANAINVESSDGSEEYVFMFQGWNTKADGSGDWHYPNGSITISENTVLYAIWNSNTALGTGNLEIQKIVSPAPASSNVAFTFKVDISNATADASFSYVVYNAATVAQRRGTITNGGTIQLYHNEYVEIADIPAVNDDNGQPNVTVMEINYDGYTPTWAGGTAGNASTTATIQGGRTSRVTCTNTQAPQDADLTITKVYSGLPDAVTKPEVTVNVKDSTGAVVGTVKLSGTTSSATVEDLTIGQTYTVEEVASSAQVSNYDLSTTYSPANAQITIASGTNAVTVTNTYTRQTSTLTVNKTFDFGTEYSDYALPTTVTVKVNGVDLVLNQSETNPLLFTGVMNSVEVGTEYTASEETIPTVDNWNHVLKDSTITGSATITKDGPNVINLTNKYERDKETVSITKNFAGLPEDAEYPESITVNVKDGDATIGTVTLTDTDGNKVFEGTSDKLLVGKTYTFVEDVPNIKYYELDAEKSTTTANVAIVDGTNSLTLTNSYKRSVEDLYIQKNVDGNIADVNKEFTFTVTIANGSVTTPDAFVSGSDSYTVTADGTITFSLHDGEYVQIKDIPLGATVTITENSDGYEAASTRVIDQAAQGEAAAETITFTHEGFSSVYYVNTKNTTVDTGITTDMAPFVIILATVAFGLFLMVGSKRRYTGRY